jgi:hypothetical protein
MGWELRLVWNVSVTPTTTTTRRVVCALQQQRLHRSRFC